MITLEAIGVMIAAVTLCGAIFKFAVIRQLETAIDNLSDLVKELRESLKANDNRVRSLEIHVTELDQRVRSNQHRLDTLETKLQANH